MTGSLPIRGGVSRNRKGGGMAKEPNVDFICEQCAKPNRVYRSRSHIRALGIPKFCNRNCFSLYVKAHPEEYAPSKGASVPAIPAPKVALKSRKNPCRNDCPHGFRGGYHGELCDTCGYKAAYLELIEEEEMAAIGEQAGGIPINDTSLMRVANRRGGYWG